MEGLISRHLKEPGTIRDARTYGHIRAGIIYGFPSRQGTPYVIYVILQYGVPGYIGHRIYFTRFLAEIMPSSYDYISLSILYFIIDIT